MQISLGAGQGAHEPEMGSKWEDGSSPLSGIVAYWKLDEANGNRADATGRGNTLTTAGTGAVASAVGKIGSAAHIVKADTSYLSMSSNADVSMGNIPFTVTAWVKPTSSGVQYWVAKGSTGASVEWVLYQLSGKADFALYSGTTQLGNAEIAPTGLLNNYHFVAGRYDGAGQINIMADGVFSANVALSGTPLKNTQALTIGSRAGGGAYADADIDEVGIWKRYLSNAELIRLYNGGAGLSIPFAEPYQLVFEGNSLTTGAGAPAGASYPLQTLALLVAAGHGNYCYNNVATSGETITQMLAQGAAQVDAKYKANYSRNIAILLAGTNDIGTGGRAAADVYADLKTWHAARKAAGLKTIALTIPRRAFAGDPPNINVVIDACNALIRSDNAGADVLCDIAADANLLDPSNVTYFADGLHLTAAGYAIVASYVDTAIRGLL